MVVLAVAVSVSLVVGGVLPAAAFEGSGGGVSAQATVAQRVAIGGDSP